MVSNGGVSDALREPGSPRVPLIERRVPDDWIALYMTSLVLAAFLIIVAWAGSDEANPDRSVAASPSHGPANQTPHRAPRPSDPPTPLDPNALPGGVKQIFAGNRMLVSYYGTAGTGSLGVLGEASPDKIMPRLVRASADFALAGRKVQPVFELIVTVAHAGPTDSGQYSSDIDTDSVKKYIAAAHRHGVLVVLDLQPGRANFLDVAKRWEWALKDPWVGLALDPEWRMGPHQVPGQQIGSVSAAEINTVTRWLDDLTAANHLPQKVFVLHQFRADMIRLMEKVVPREHLAMIQHLDGYGPPRVKLATFHALARPAQFRLGFKLFYDEDRPRMTARQVLRIRPRVSFVSFQ
jgi:hypothetical protein